MSTPYRAVINQPSTLQPLHHLHGRYCIAVESDKDRNDVTLYFTEGDLHSMTAFRHWISRVKLSSAED